MSVRAYAKCKTVFVCSFSILCTSSAFLCFAVKTFVFFVGFGSFPLPEKCAFTFVEKNLYTYYIYVYGYCPLDVTKAARRGRTKTPDGALNQLKLV